MSRLAELCRKGVVRPALERMGLWSPSAEELLMMTAAHESAFVHRQQIGGGPALGLFQMERATHDDIWARYLIARGFLRATVRAFIAAGDVPRAEDMLGNDLYAAAMCRVHYLRVPEPLPAADDLDGLAIYCKAFYNTPAGKATPEKYLADYRRLVLDEPPRTIAGSPTTDPPDEETS